MFGTKKKLMAAVVMLVISAIMMTSASYAWFTISTNPEISDIKTKVVVNENLEIALSKTNKKAPAITAENQSGNQYTWGNIIDLSETEFGEVVDTTLRPITLNTSNEFKVPIYGADGRIKGDLNSITEVDVEEGFGHLTNIYENDDEDEVEEICGFYMDFWIRSNMDGYLKLLGTGVDTTSVEVDDGVDFGSRVWVTGSADEDEDALIEEQVNDLAKGLIIAFKELSSLAEDGVTTTPSTTTVPVLSTTADKAVEFDADGNTTKEAWTLAFENDEIVELEAGVGKLIRMYVYYEGKELSNNDAILGDAFVNANLNIQFALAKTGETDTILVDTSMDLN